MLVSKIKPCMSQYKHLTRRNCEWLIKAVIVYLLVAPTWITVVILELIHASKPDFAEGLCLLDTEPTQVSPGHVVIHDNLTNCVALPTMRLSASDGRVLAYRGNDG